MHLAVLIVFCLDCDSKAIFLVFKVIYFNTEMMMMILIPIFLKFGIKIIIIIFIMQIFLIRYIINYITN